MFRFILALSILSLASLVLRSETKSESGYIATLKATEDGSNYQVGQTAIFKLYLTKDGKPVDNAEVHGQISKEDVSLNRHFGAKTKDGTVLISYKMKEAGFLRCSASVKVKDADGKPKTISLLAGAAFEPLKIEASMEAPKDFKEYWEAQTKMLSSVPLNIVMRKVGDTDSDVELFDISADMHVGVLRGYYARPKNAAAKSCAAIILPHGAGVRSSSSASAVAWAKRGFIALDFNAHGIPNGMPKQFYEFLANSDLRNYFKIGVHDKNTTYMRSIYLRAFRALEVLTAQPEWDGKNLVSFGASQGGAQSIAAAALCDKVSYAVIGVAGMCDNTAFLKGRAVGGGWFAADRNSQKVDKPAVEASRYIDCVNFARNIKCPTFWTVNYADNVCPPSGQFAAYNAVSAPKGFSVYEESRHALSPEYYKKSVERILENVKNNK